MLGVVGGEEDGIALLGEGAHLLQHAELVAVVQREMCIRDRGSGSEATAESCGGTVLVTDNGTRKNRLREEHRQV